jgi:hypothetical protein
MDSFCVKSTFHKSFSGHTVSVCSRLFSVSCRTLKMATEAMKRRPIG